MPCNEVWRSRILTGESTDQCHRRRMARTHAIRSAIKRCRIGLGRGEAIGITHMHLVLAGWSSGTQMPDDEALLEAMPKESKGIYRCRKCDAINSHPSERCDTDESYGYARGSESQSSTHAGPPTKCGECGGWGHHWTICPEVDCHRCGEKGHVGWNCPRSRR